MTPLIEVDIRTLAHQLARQTMAYPFKIWGFGEGIALEALWHAGKLLDEPAYQDFVVSTFDCWLTRQPRLQEADHSAPGDLLLTVYEQMPDKCYLQQAHLLAGMMCRLPVTQNQARLHRPHHADYHDYLYVDCMEVDAPFLCKLASVNEALSGYDPMPLYDEAVRQLLGYVELLYDPKECLFNHQYNSATQQVNGAFWGRGNGWALLGMLKTLRYLPKTHSSWTAIHTLFVQLVDSLATYQHPDGTWSTVINQPDTYREASLPAMFGYAIQTAIYEDLLPHTYQWVADAAWAAMQPQVERGVLRGVSVATPPGNAGHYAQVAVGAGYPWGQGPALLFTLARLAENALLAAPVA